MSRYATGAPVADPGRRNGGGSPSELGAVAERRSPRATCRRTAGEHSSRPSATAERRKVVHPQQRRVDEVLVNGARRAARRRGRPGARFVRLFWRRRLSEPRILEEVGSLVAIGIARRVASRCSRRSIAPLINSARPQALLVGSCPDGRRLNGSAFTIYPAATIRDVMYASGWIADPSRSGARARRIRICPGRPARGLQWSTSSCAAASPKCGVTEARSTGARPVGAARRGAATRSGVARSSSPRRAV